MLFEYLLSPQKLRHHQHSTFFLFKRYLQSRFEGHPHLIIKKISVPKSPLLHGYANREQIAYGTINQYLEIRQYLVQSVCNHFDLEKAHL